MPSLTDECIIVCTVNCWKIPPFLPQLGQSLFLQDQKRIDNLSTKLNVIFHETRYKKAVKPSLIDECIIVCTVNSCKIPPFLPQLGQSLFLQEQTSIDNLRTKLTVVCLETRQKFPVKPSIIDACIKVRTVNS